jgi:ActR/RegA family two-component response regulator
LAKTEGWLLLAEDDRLFGGLFQRFFSARYSQVEVQRTCSLAGAKALLEEAVTPPLLAVFDLNLKDGCSENLCSSLNCPTVLWSADSRFDVRSKPRGRQQLEESILELGRIAGLEVPFP